MHEPAIIALETSSKNGSVALARGGRLLGAQPFSTQTEHARELLPALVELLAATGCATSEIKQCHLSIGPGSFTGLRVAVTFARHLALAVGARIVAVPTLAVIADNCAHLTPPLSPLAVILDAKRGQVFGTAFCHRDGAYLPMTQPGVVSPDALFATLPPPCFVTGEGVEYHLEALQRAGATVVDRSLWIPEAKTVHKLGWSMAERGEFTMPRDLIPLYLRRPEAEEVWEKREQQKSSLDAAR